MPSNSIKAAPFSSAFIGDSASSIALEVISDLRTNGAVISETLPTVFLPSLGRDIQSGNHTVSVTLTFLGDSDLTTKLARGIPISGDPDDPPGTSLYSLLLLYPDTTEKSSYYFPSMRVDKNFSANYSKGVVTSVAVTFTGEARSVSTNIFYKDTPAALDTIMGSKSPI